MSRTSRQRAAVVATFDELNGFSSVQDVHAQMRAAGDGIGLSTVYRAVQTLVEEGRLDAIRTDTGETIYRRCSPQHHHHLICRTCGRTVEVEGPAVERWADRIAAENGFADVSHTLDVFGTCTNCTAEAGPPSVTPSDRSTA
jgi:Fur family ferric uptake transcriptional regulator